MPGPAVTTSSEGRQKKKIGNTSFTPTFPARSSASWRRRMRRIIRLGAQRFCYAGSKAIGLDQNRHQLLDFVFAGAPPEIAQRLGSTFARHDLHIHDATDLR